MAKTCLIFAVAAFFSCFIPCLATDQAALLALKAYITSDPFEILAKSWSSSSNTTICTWIGVSCEANTKRVTALNLTKMSLGGTMAPHLGNLTSLTSLDLSFNNFHGVLPKELGKLHNLRRLVLLNNSVNGTIPSSILNISKLETLNLGNNFIGGKIPKGIGKLLELRMLDLKFNQISGLVPAVVFNMPALRVIDLSSNSLSDILPFGMCSNFSKLEGLYLSSNELHGQIPASLYKCKELQYLSLANNKFSGSLAREIGNLTNLKQLNLGTNNFKGVIPQEIGNLKLLEQLIIQNGSLIGPIPSSIFNLSSLEILDLRMNRLSGSLPMEIRYNVPALKLLYLSDNFLTGQIPVALWECKGLQRLTLADNSFTGSISKNIGNLTLLRDLNLGYNNFTGKLPSEIGYLKLRLLFVHFNNLTGTIPSEVFNISTMSTMTLQENQFSGHLPSDLGIWLPNLVGFFIGRNKFSGLIPSSISNASNLIILEMSRNSFSGPLPNNLGNLRFLQRLYVDENNLTRESSTTELRFLSSLTNCRDLEVLGISVNQLNGVLPAAFGNLSTNLKFLAAFGSKIKGEIPIGIGNLSSLDAMILDSNELTGRIPSSIGMLKNIERIYLEHNRLQGSIPYELCLLDRMGDLYLSDNQLNGSIPACLGELRSLRRLYLDSNKFSSKIPSSLWTRVDLVELNLSTNLLSGDLASEIGQLKMTTQMDLSWNQLSGNVPASIGGAQSLNYLSLAHNKLQGSISQSLGSLLGLEFLDLSNNNFSGKIPKSLEALRYLHYFNVSSNKLEGEIPTGGVFVNFTAQSYMQNYALCGAPRLLVQLCQKRTPHQSGSRNISVKYILPPIAAVILLVALIFVLRKCRKQNILLTGEDSLPHAWRRVSYIELSRATDGFSETNLLGVGGFGSVYKGTLSDGMIVAVKVFHLQHEGASKSFDAECEVMRNVRHRNLTKLISSCTNLDFKALVLEWMPNGCLEKCLYSQNYCLDILERLNIMIDVASALNYLHHGHPTPIVHCDLKPSNVLLDRDMIAHVCDFGIAKILGEEEFMARTKTLATIGYMAPEYGREGIVSTRGDVYSYGYMLMETFTRKKPTDEMFSPEKSFKDWVEEGLHGSVIQVLDAGLIGEEDKRFYVKEQCALSIFGLAMDCSRNVPIERITMEDVVARLSKIKTTFVEQCHITDI